MKSLTINQQHDVFAKEKKSNNKMTEPKQVQFFFF